MSPKLDHLGVDSILSMLEKKEISEVEFLSYVNRVQNDMMFQHFSRSVFNQYLGLIERVGPSINCNNNWQDILVFSEKALRKACNEIETDLSVTLARRKQLVGKDDKTGYAKLARGKVAGITTFRLAKFNIIQINNICLSCRNPLCGGSIYTLNSAFAIKCGLHFINKSYKNIPKEIRRELLYTLTNRHTNQETLGIVFDTFKILIP